MSGSAIAAEVLEGLQEALADTGPSAGTFLLRDGAPSGPVYNRTPGGRTATACTALFSSYRQDQIDGTIIRQDDVRALVGVFSLVPVAGDFFQGNGNLFSVVSVRKIRPAGVDIMYELQLREVGTGVFDPLAPSGFSAGFDEGF